MAAAYLLALGLLLASAAADPLVTLNHGGQLRGKQFDYNGVNIDLFLGVPYAEPPIGSLRFQKPRPTRPWTGTRDAVTVGNFCVQSDLTGGTYSGDEDCLLMDITVPGGVDPTRKKPVMVWIHGGAYIIGSKSAYIGATLAKHGDVIVVAINYRLGFLGFLSDGPGSGNMGLWDQRAALLWIQENIALFGGDPDLVTIFGESAGAGSVSAQMMGQHNDGLFKRAIQESGTLYTDWGWFLSERRRYELAQDIKKQQRCPPTQSVYDCLEGLSVEAMVAVMPKFSLTDNIWHPVPDGDFFSSEVLNETYGLSRRFDLMAGFNGQEGAFSVFLFTITGKTNESITDGISQKYADLWLSDFCMRVTPLSADLCSKFCSNLYGLESITNDKERGIQLSFLYGELSFNAETIRQLSDHSQGSTQTFAYQFSENIPLPSGFPSGYPTWTKVSAKHGDEISFVFGGIYNTEYDIQKEYLGEEITPEMELTVSFMDGATERDKPLTDLMMTAWTNFAKSGNPNQPTALPGRAPEWPQFNRATNQFIEFKSDGTKVITTPHKERLDKLVNSLFSARTAQLKADVAPEPSCEETGDKKDAVIG